MTVTNVQKDLEALTLTVTAEYDVTAERAWRLWADPRQLERWWGPPTYPATVVEHDLRPGGTVHYYMTGPEGDQPHGGWEVLAVDPPRHLEVRDYFADADGVWLDRDAGIGLSHRRLAIVDLTEAGRQPMASASGRFVIAFNGEIYNHVEMRAKLEAAACAPEWRGHSDTETLLAAIEAWGIERTLAESVGMFAFAVWDRVERRLDCRLPHRFGRPRNRDRVAQAQGWLGRTAGPIGSRAVRDPLSPAAGHVAPLQSTMPPSGQRDGGGRWTCRRTLARPRSPHRARAAR